eukprot:scaffold4061_cov222-Pinguiococcus_pyrenoidosus.AAC.4
MGGVPDKNDTLPTLVSGQRCRTTWDFRRNLADESAVARRKGARSSRLGMEGVGEGGDQAAVPPVCHIRLTEEPLDVERYPRIAAPRQPVD